MKLIAHLLDDVVDEHERHRARQEIGLDDGDEDQRRRQLKQAVAQLRHALGAAPGQDERFRQTGHHYE